LTVDDRALAVLGIDPRDRQEQMEAWLSIIHPEDLPRVLKATDEAVRSRSL
jgi:hypothetical protein